MLPFWVISFFICHTFPIKSLYTKFKESFQLGTTFYDDFSRLHRRLIAPLNTVVVENTRDLVLSKQATGRTKFKLKWLWRMAFLQDIFFIMSNFKALDVKVEVNLPDHLQTRLETFDEDTLKTERFFVFILGWSKFCLENKHTWQSPGDAPYYYFDTSNGSFNVRVYTHQATDAFCIPIKLRDFLAREHSDEMSSCYVEAWEEVLSSSKAKEKGQKRKGINLNAPVTNTPHPPPPSSTKNSILKKEPDKPLEDLVSVEYKEECSKLQVSESDSIEEVK